MAKKLAALRSTNIERLGHRPPAAWHQFTTSMLPEICQLAVAGQASLLPETASLADTATAWTQPTTPNMRLVVQM